jgi:iron(III) transport system permease protein
VNDTPSAAALPLTPPRRQRRRLFDGWLASALLVALLVALPVLAVFSFVLDPAASVWRHLGATVLGDYIANSLWLMLWVTIGVVAIGVPCAWLTSVCDFPGRRWLEWALLLPLAMPAYIIAYTYTGLLDFAGPVQTALRTTFDWSYGDYWFPPIRSLGGACAMFVLVLYPYVYMLARAAFLSQSRCALEVSRTLGAGPWRGFFTVALPLARPAVIAGVSLALMETLADYGTVVYFGVTTFTTGIFRTWYGLGNAAAAAQLAAVLMLFVFVLIISERWSRRRQRYHHGSARFRALARHRLRGWQAVLASCVCLLPLLLGFVVPVLQLGQWALLTYEQSLNATFVTIALQTLLLASTAALLVLAIALLLGYGKRLHSSRLLRSAVQIAGIGYAVPGTVIAVGVMLPFAAFDHTVDAFMSRYWGISTGLLLSGTLVALLFAYAVRFLAVALQTVEAGLGRIRPSTDDAARSLGLSPGSVLRRIHLPLLRGSLLTAIVLVFVDVLKELPATLILRPFNFNTLAVRTYELASDERLAEASLPALAIVAIGLLPVILLSRAIRRPATGEVDAALTGH